MPPAQLSSLLPKSIGDIGAFSLAAEAAKLLRRVFKHVKSDSFDSDAHDEEAGLLDSALRALENLVETGGNEKMVDVMHQVALCTMYGLKCKSTKHAADYLQCSFCTSRNPHLETNRHG
jgi:hypothetical protein